MKRSFITMLITMPMVLCAGSLVANNNDDDFKEIAVSDQIMIEQTSKASGGIDWQFELVNKDSKPILLKISQGKEEILSEDGMLLNPGKVVRIAGLKRMEDDDWFEIKVSYILKTTGRSASTERAFYFMGDTTVYMEFKDGELKPLEKSFFKRSTDSGLPLDKNIKE